MPSPYNIKNPVTTKNDFYGFDEQLKAMQSFIDESINGIKGINEAIPCGIPKFKVKG